jgi:hypothetical protein
MKVVAESVLVKKPPLCEIDLFLPQLDQQMKVVGRNVLVKKPPLCEGSFLFATARPANEGGGRKRAYKESASV